MGMISDLRGVTVRNTFVELEDPGVDAILNDSGFARQSSEPARPVHQREDRGSYAYEKHLRKDVTEVPPMPGGWQPTMPQYRFDVSCAKPQQFGTGSLTESMNMMSPPVFQAAFMPQSNNLPAVRFCPNCGAQAQEAHRFCPYCCFQFQGVMTATAAFGNIIGDKSDNMPPGDSTNLLMCLRRFRYIEATSPDVDRAHAVVNNLTGIIGGSS